jgi:hypothetical protein
MASPDAQPPGREVVGYPPLSEISDAQRREFHEALLDDDAFEDLPGKWQAAILTAEQNRPKLRLVRADQRPHAIPARRNAKSRRARRSSGVHPTAWSRSCYAREALHLSLRVAERIVPALDKRVHETAE